VGENGSGKPSCALGRDHEGIRPVRTRRDAPGAIRSDSVRGVSRNFRHALLVARVSPCLLADE